MLIDDNEIDNFINVKMMEGCSFAEHIHVHTSSKSALEFLLNIERTGDAGRILFPKVIFVDINMPIMDGFQFITEFEKFPDALKNDTQINILTTSLNPDDMEKAKRHKLIRKFLNKPLNEKTLDTL